MLYDTLHDVLFEKIIKADNWQAQYRLITTWGTLISAKPELQQPEYLLKGCETSAWLKHDYVDGRHRFLFDSQSRVMNGVVALVLSVVDNKTSAELMLLDVSDAFAQAGLEKHLTPSRNSGLHNIIARMYSLAGLDRK